MLSAREPGVGPAGECRLLGPFALLVQAALGALALLSLVYKRWRERPQRPVRIWLFDVSKQVLGSVLVHAANVFLSMLTSGRFSIRPEDKLPRDHDASRRHNPCSSYLLNLAIDTTAGIPILILFFRLATSLAARTPFGRPAESIQSGNYGDPPNPLWWLKQSIIYFCGLFAMKLCVLLIFVLFPWISSIGDWALGWTEGNERLQIAFSMMIFPLIMNAMQYYIIDSFIKKKDPQPAHQPLPARDPDHAQSARLGHDDDDGGDADDVVDLDDDDDDDNTQDLDLGSDSGHDPRHGGGHRPVRLQHRRVTREYDPDRDGDELLATASPASRPGERDDAPVRDLLSTPPRPKPA